MIANMDTDKPTLVTSEVLHKLCYLVEILYVSYRQAGTGNKFFKTMFCCGDMFPSKIYYVISKRRANKPSSRKLSTEKNSNFTCDAISCHTI